MEAPFVVTEPERNETPVIVEVPHAGLAIPEFARGALEAELPSIARDADLFVHELYADAPLEGATLLVANVSRYVVDLNRREDEIDSESVQGALTGVHAPHGLIWTHASDGARVLARPLTRVELGDRLTRLHRPYHEALRAIVERKKRLFGRVVILAAHSMPSFGRGSSGEETPRADVVPGTRGRTSADARFIDLVDAHAAARGWSVRHDDPYRGGYTTQHYGRPLYEVHAIQVELARRLYMDEALLRPKPDAFATTRSWSRALVAKLGQRALG